MRDGDTSVSTSFAMCRFSLYALNAAPEISRSNRSMMIGKELIVPAVEMRPE